MIAMAKTKICIVGGGSYNWSPIVLRDIAAATDLSGDIVLHDINLAALEDIRQLGRKIMTIAGADFTVEATTDLAAALRGAEFVIVTITTGGLEAMRRDLDIPRKYGIYQAVGDTVGPGGLSRALRNIPVIVEIARTIERVCPDAWLLNLTNPMTTLTRAVAKTTGLKVIGLCHELFGVRATMKEMFAASNDDMQMRVAGVNHLIWLLDLKIKGQDGFRMIREYLAGGRQIPVRTSGAAGPFPSFRDHWQVKLALFEIFGYLPAAGDRHVAEFFPYFLTDEHHAGADYGVLLTEIDHRYQVARNAQASVRAWIESADPPPIKRSEEEVVDIIAAVANGRSLHTIVNLPNRGQIDNLPREAVVETMGMVGPNGAYGVSVGALPPGVLNTVHPHVLNQELIVDAALAGDRKLALQALINDPLVRDFRTAPQMLDELLLAQAEYLPQF
jgi:alpha-galactosidase/6-phospho-beta-glucosidase family protein